MAEEEEEEGNDETVEEVGDTNEKVADPEGREDNGDGDEDELDPEALGDDPRLPEHAQRLRKGFRINSVCWD